MDIDEVEVPSKGNWQCVVKHVSKGVYVFARLSTGEEVRRSIISPYRQEVSESVEEPGANTAGKACKW